MNSALLSLRSSSLHPAKERGRKRKRRPILRNESKKKKRRRRRRGKERSRII
jgi:hypothetical protein